MSTGPSPPLLLTGATRWTVIATLFVSALAWTLSTKATVLQTTLIVQALDSDRYKAQWVTGAEGVVGLVMVFVPLYYVRVVGVRWLFSLGMLCLALGSVGTSLSQNQWQAGISGVLRGCSGLFAIPALILLGQLMPRRKGVAMCALLAMVYGGQVLAEPLGSMSAFHPSWRAIFLFIAVCGLWGTLCGLFLFADDWPFQKPATPFDWLGALLLAVWLAIVLFIFYRGNYLGWGVSTRILGALAALAAATGLFIWRQLTAPEPFISLAGFTFRTVAITMLAAAFWSASMYGVAIQFSQYLLFRGYENWKAGWVLLPMSLIMIATMVLGGFIKQRPRFVWALRIGLIGMTWLNYQLTRVDLCTSWQWLMATTSLWGLFAGLCLPAIARLVYEGQPPEQAATTGAMKFFMRSFGGTAGILVAGILIDRATAWGLDYVRDSITLGQGALQVAEPAIRDHMVRRGSAPAEAVVQGEAVLASWVNLHARLIGYRVGLQFCTWLSAISLAISFLIHRRKEISVLDSDD